MRQVLVIASVVLLAAVGCGDGNGLDDATDEVAVEDSPSRARVETLTTSPTATEEPEPEPETEAEAEPEPEPEEDDPAETKLLEVAVMDYTEQNPPGARLKIWVRGHGSWYPDVEFGGDGPQEMGEFPVGELQTDDFYIYPDGRDGTEILVESR